MFASGNLLTISISRGCPLLSPFRIISVFTSHRLLVIRLRQPFFGSEHVTPIYGVGVHLRRHGLGDPGRIVVIDGFAAAGLGGSFGYAGGFAAFDGCVLGIAGGGGVGGGFGS